MNAGNLGDRAAPPMTRNWMEKKADRRKVVATVGSANKAQLHYPTDLGPSQ